jgi:rhomboid family GlyGly-CTERM serine protease
VLTLSRGVGWWCGISVLLCAGAMIVHDRAADAIDWQPLLAWSQPWRWWSAAWVHLSDLHLQANLAGTLLVAMLGVASDVPLRAAMAWLVAWPLTQLGLLAEPALAHYGGLSGVLHAGVAVVAVQLMIEGPGRRRWIGAALLAGLAVKLISEAPWDGVVQHPQHLDIPTVPLAHVSGVVSGLIACALLLGITQRPPATAGRHD